MIGRPFQPGQSGNPSGRPKGIAKAFRETLKDPSEAAAGLLEIARGEVAGVKPGERIAAWRELLDRGYGKAASFAAIEGADPLELDDVAREIAAIADELRARRESKEPAGAGSELPDAATG